MIQCKSNWRQGRYRQGYILSLYHPELILILFGIWQDNSLSLSVNVVHKIFMTDIGKWKKIVSMFVTNTEMKKKKSAHMPLTHTLHRFNVARSLCWDHTQLLDRFSQHYITYGLLHLGLNSNAQ